MSHDIGNPAVGSMLGHVESQAGHHRRRRGGPHPGRGRPHLRRLQGLGLQAGRPLPRRGRGRLRTAIPTTQDLPAALERVVELILELRRKLATPAWTPARTPSPGTWQHHHASVPVDHQPPPHPRRTGHPRTEEAPEVLLRPVRGRHAQRDLAVRLHPLPAEPTGVDVEIISWLDDCTRYALHVTAHPRVTGRS